MRFAIVGSRNYPDLDRVRGYIGWLHGEWRRADTWLSSNGLVIVTGGAAGVDQHAAACASTLGIHVEEILPDWSAGRGAALERNTKIVEAADEVIAFCARCTKCLDPTNCPWRGWSHGTSDTISKARFAGKPVTIYSAP